MGRLQLNFKASLKFRAVLFFFKFQANGFWLPVEGRGGLGNSSLHYCPKDPSVALLSHWLNHRGFRHYPVAALHSLTLECSHQLPLQKGKDICESLFSLERVTVAAWSEVFLSRN